MRDVKQFSVTNFFLYFKINFTYNNYSFDDIVCIDKTPSALL